MILICDMALNLIAIKTRNFACPMNKFELHLAMAASSDNITVINLVSIFFQCDVLNERLTTSIECNVRRSCNQLTSSSGSTSTTTSSSTHHLEVSNLPTAVRYQR